MRGERACGGDGVIAWIRYQWRWWRWFLEWQKPGNPELWSGFEEWLKREPKR